MSAGAADDDGLLADINEALEAIADTEKAPSPDDEGEGDEAEAGSGAARGAAAGRPKSWGQWERFSKRDGQEVEYEVVACTRKARKDLRVGVDADDPAAWQNLRAAVLCIGLGEYKHLPVLPNATRDARALCDRVNALPHCRARLLADLPDRRALQKGIRTFLKEPGLQQMPPETVLINYSGHGTQRGGTVYMLPEDADLDDATCEPDADFLPIRDIFKWCREDLDKVARDLDLPRRVTFVLVLDACRVAEMDLATLSSSLEPPPTSAPKKWALCFSCSRDSAASDGPSGSHSPFAQGLLDEDAGIFAAGVPLKGGLEAACRRVSAQHKGQDPIPLLHHIQENWCLCPGTSPGPAPSPSAAAGNEAMPPAPFSPGSQGSPKKVGAQCADAAGFWQDAFFDADHVQWSLFAAALQDEFDFVQGDAILAQIRDKVDIERNGIISARGFHIFTRKRGLEGACRAALGTGHAETDTVQVITAGATRVLRGMCGGCGKHVYNDEARRQEGSQYYHERCSAPCVTAQVSPDSSPRPLGVLSGTGTQEAESEVKGEFAEQSCKEDGQEAAAAEEKKASSRAKHEEVPAPSARAMSVAQIKAELRSRGVPELYIDTCTERRELEDLLKEAESKLQGECTWQNFKDNDQEAAAEEEREPSACNLHEEMPAPSTPAMGLRVSAVTMRDAIGRVIIEDGMARMIPGGSAPNLDRARAEEQAQAEEQNSQDPVQEQIDFTSVQERVSESLSFLQKFVTTTVPKSQSEPIQCYVRRKKGIFGKTKYTLFTQSGPGGSDQALLWAQGSDTEQRVCDFQQGVVGKCQSNFVGTEWTMFVGAGTSQFGSVHYDRNVLGRNGPRKMEVFVPHPECPPASAFSRRADASAAQTGTSLKLVNKTARWNESLGAFCLNFQGRVTVASVKNFQLVEEQNEDTVVLQFGKCSDNNFTMDYRYPLCALQAFEICLTSMARKLACE